MLDRWKGTLTSSEADINQCTARKCCQLLLLVIAFSICFAKEQKTEWISQATAPLELLELEGVQSFSRELHLFSSLLHYILWVTDIWQTEYWNFTSSSELWRQNNACHISKKLQRKILSSKLMETPEGNKTAKLH